MSIVNKFKNFRSIWYLLKKQKAGIFPGSKEYWEERYASGGTSGDGSYNKLAEFKAEVINSFVKKTKAASMIEFGCGDGNQLKLTKYPKYLGFDVSPRAIKICGNAFNSDKSKTFKLIGDYDGEIGELALSLDVIYHLVEDDVFYDYMIRLFRSSSKYVIIYSSNEVTYSEKYADHVKHRRFTDFISKNFKEWELLKFIKNKYPYSKETGLGSFADFYIYKKHERR